MATQDGGLDDVLPVYGPQVVVVVWNQKDQMNIVPVKDDFDEIDEIVAVQGDMSVHLVE